MIIAVDFDGTIAEHKFPEIGPPVPDVFFWLKKFQRLGAKLILYTMRSNGQKVGDVLQEAIDFCKSFGVEFWGINTNPEQLSWTDSPKTYAKIYIDDNAYGIPLIYPEDGRRPYVDWSIVGPGILKWMESEFGIDIGEKK